MLSNSTRRNLTVRIIAVLTTFALLSPVQSSSANTNASHQTIPQTQPSAAADNYSPSYPRIGIFHFGSAPADWYAKHDLVMVGSGEYLGEQIKAISPSTLNIPTRGWTAYVSPSRYPIPVSDFDASAFLVDDSNGDDVYLNCCNRMIDQSIFSRDAKSGRFSGLSILEALPVQVVEQSLLNINDGVATDWLWRKPYGISDIDMDRNGVNDFDEHGKAWVDAKWQEGTVELLANLRAELDKAGSSKTSLINFGFQWQKLGVEYINGMVREWTTGFGNNFETGYFWNDEYKYFMEVAPFPHVAIIDARPDRSDPFITALSDKTDSRNHLQSMRYLLGVTLLGDAYFNYMTFEEAQSTQNHHIHQWYDEFDLDLGQPIDLGRFGPLDDALKLKAGVWVRFFDKGVSIVNVTGNSVNVSNQELKSLPGYAGPYWRFEGGQDISLNGGNALNTGAAFTSVSLNGYTWQKGNQIKPLGDAIILLRSPQTIISDIIVDNNDFSTSPGSFEAALSGGFSLQMKGGRNHWSVYSHKQGRAYGGVDYWHTHARSDSDGTAIFTPSIGVGGSYEVFEWHGYLGSDTGDVNEASNVSITISHAGGTANRSVDQSRNDGQWNSLGTFTFNKGTSGKVILSAQGANGPVIADAFKFVYQDGSKPPDPPTFVDVPFDHWAHDEIETLYQGGYVSGCSSAPLMYCPENAMTRAESAVFVVRGINGAAYTPPDPGQLIFADVPLSEWFSKWSAALWNAGYTAGCGTNPLVYCPLQEHTRTEGTVFFLRMLHGASYTPPDPRGIFADVSIEFWGAKWIEEAYKAGLIPACASAPELKFCPDDPLTRAMAASMMVQAKGLPIN